MLKKTLQCLLFSAGIVFCVNEKSLSQVKSDSSWHKNFSLALYNFNYLRDYEYFSPIMEGYTLYGSIVQPELKYKFSNHVSLNAGVFVQQNFGDDSLRVRPTFLLKLKNRATEFSFGNYRSEGYELIEPLYFRDNLVKENLDNGFLLKQYFGRLDIIQWLDWEKAIQNGSDFQERVWGGATINFHPLTRYNKAIQFPAQCYLQHTGGQINVADTSFYVKTILNACAGIKSELSPAEFSHVKFGGEGYFVYYKNFSPLPLEKFNSGNGIWLSAYLKIPNGKKKQNSFNVILSYWDGTNFISPKGNPLFQSISSVYPDSDYTEKNRKLFLLALKYELVVDEKFKLDISFEPYYDLNNQLLEYGIHLQTVFPFEPEKNYREHPWIGTPRF